MILLSVTGLVRILLIVLAVLFLLKILEKMAQSGRKMTHEQKMKNAEQMDQRTREQAKENYGKTSISKIEKGEISDTEYTDFEEVD